VCASRGLAICVSAAGSSHLNAALARRAAHRGRFALPICSWWGEASRPSRFLHWE
jgi:hypothetical protein